MSSTIGKVLARPELLAALSPLRAAGRRIALANGLFDILHVGHLRYLESAALEADVLVVGVNSDRSAKELKGPGRPITPQDERAELIAGLSCVAYVTIFDEPTAAELLRALRPHVHCKGTDYAPDTVPESALARELGIRVAIVGDLKHHSTSHIIDRLRG